MVCVLSGIYLLFSVCICWLCIMLSVCVSIVFLLLISVLGRLCGISELFVW